MKRVTATRAGLATAAVTVAVLALAGCNRNGSSGAAPATFGPAASQASARYSSAMANPTVSADAAQAKAIVKQCIPGTPLQQAHTVHLVFLSSATGKHGPEVVAARTRVFGCMGVPASQRTSFANDAITAAEHGKVYTQAGRRTYLEATLPQLVLKYRNASGYTPPASPGPGTVPGVTPSPATTGA